MVPHGSSLGLLLHALQAPDRRLHRRRRRRGELPSAACHSLVAALAMPDAHRLALHARLAAERAEVLRPLLRLDLLHELTEGRAVPGPVFPGNSDLLRTTSHGDRIGAL